MLSRPMSLLPRFESARQFRLSPTLNTVPKAKTPMAQTETHQRTTIGLQKKKEDTVSSLELKIGDHV